ncbi:MAG TPA: diguanylate cyclase, partial [Anaerolineae bacterium]|nr:diguanylate cyclase [Anaerolineae bacterium]
ARFLDEGAPWRGLLLLYADVDGMKWINDNLGHHTGDEALREFNETIDAWPLSLYGQQARAALERRRSTGSMVSKKTGESEEEDKTGDEGAS